jgi:hypothetical protein
VDRGTEAGRSEENTPEKTLVTEQSGETPDGREKAEPAREKAAPSVGFLSMSVEPDAEIIVDGMHRLNGSSLGPLDLPSGEHDVICRKEGYREYRERIRITRGELSRRSIILQRITGAVHFVTDAGAQIYVDGTYSGRTPLERPLQLPTGNHLIELRRIGYKNWSNTVYVPADESLTLRITLVPQ